MAFMTKEEYEEYVAKHASNVVSTEDIAHITIIDFEVFPIYECILARDRRMYDSSGGWFGLFETPTILSNSGKRKMDANQPIDYSSYGRKENEGKDLNEDTNFGKLKRIPYDPLHQYIKPDNFTSFFEEE